MFDDHAGQKLDNAKSARRDVEGLDPNDEFSSRMFDDHIGQKRDDDVAGEAKH